MKKPEQTVNLGEIKYGKGDDVLACYGLGSCVGVAIYDLGTQIGGLAHIVLPKDPKYKAKGRKNNSHLATLRLSQNPGKFADSGLLILVDYLFKKGATKSGLRAKIAGGASVLAPIMIGSKDLEIGKRNIEAVEKVLDELKIPIVARAIGGNKGRTMRFNLNDRSVEVSTFGLAKTIL